MSVGELTSPDSRWVSGAVSWPDAFDVVSAGSSETLGMMIDWVVPSSDGAGFCSETVDIIGDSTRGEFGGECWLTGSGSDTISEADSDGAGLSETTGKTTDNGSSRVRGASEGRS